MIRTIAALLVSLWLAVAAQACNVPGTGDCVQLNNGTSSSQLPTGTSAVTNSNPFDASTAVSTNQFVLNQSLASMSTAPLTLTSGTYSFATKATSFPVLICTANGSNALTGCTVALGGAGFAVGDLIQPTGGNHDAILRVTGVTGGVPNTVAVVYGGTGYATGGGIASAALTVLPYTYLLSGTLTGNVTIIVTNGSFIFGSQQWLFGNNTTGAFTVTVCVSNGSDACSGGRTAVIPQGTNNSRLVGVQTDGVTNVDLFGIVNAADLTGTALPAAVVIPNANLANMPADTLKGNVTASSATPSDLTVTQFKALTGIPINVTDPAYGAKCDGTTNDYTAIVNAITNNGGAVIQLPSGICSIVIPSGGNLAAPASGTVIKGYGKSSTTLKITPTGSSFAELFILSNPHLTFSDMTLNLVTDGTGTQQFTIYDMQASDLKFINVAYTGNAIEGVLIGGTATNGDAIKVVFSCSCLIGSPITITANITTSETTAQMATALAAAINANATITGQGISASAAGSMVSIPQPETLLPQASYTTTVTGAATETMTIQSSGFNTAIWAITNNAAESDDVLISDNDASGFQSTILKPNATTQANRRWTIRGGTWIGNITGAVNINSPSGTFDRVMIDGIHVGSIGNSCTSCGLGIAIANVTNSIITNNVMKGTYDVNAIHLEENSSAITITGNTIKQATSTNAGAGYNGSCILSLDNNVGGAGFRPVNDVTITGNTCQAFSASNISGYGINNQINSTTGNNWTVSGNTLVGYAGGALINVSGVAFSGNTLVANSAAGTAITTGSSTASAIVSNNAISTYTTFYSLAGTVKVDDMNGISVANLPSGAANGSHIFATDGLPASSPCTGTSTGSTAFRQNGAWKCF